MAHDNRMVLLVQPLLLQLHAGGVFAQAQVQRRVGSSSDKVRMVPRGRRSSEAIRERNVEEVALRVKPAHRRREQLRHRQPASSSGGGPEDNVRL